MDFRQALARPAEEQRDHPSCISLIILIGAKEVD
jgi:hypothetical protein